MFLSLFGIKTQFYLIVLDVNRVEYYHLMQIADVT